VNDYKPSIPGNSGKMADPMTHKAVGFLNESFTMESESKIYSGRETAWARRKK
jgi:hypothetical protein